MIKLFAKKTSEIVMVVLAKICENIFLMRKKINCINKIEYITLKRLRIKELLYCSVFFV